MGKVTAFCLISINLFPCTPASVSLHGGEKSRQPKTIDGSPSLPPPGSDPVPFRPCRHLSDLLARRVTAACIMQLGSLVKRTGAAGWHGTKKLRCGWDLSSGRRRMNGSVSYRLALEHRIPYRLLGHRQRNRGDIRFLRSESHNGRCSAVLWCVTAPSGRYCARESRGVVMFF